jgi:hypothetical protein
MIQAVSPEFKPSEAMADERGKVDRVAAVTKHFSFIFKRFPPLKIWNFEFQMSIEELRNAIELFFAYNFVRRSKSD